MRQRRWGLVGGLFLAVMAVLWWVSAAGAVDDTARGGSAAKADHGSLVVTVGGLPSGTRPSGVIRGKGLIRRVSKARTVIRRAKPGVYRVRLSTVTVRRSRGKIEKGARLVPAARMGRVRVRVRAGRRAKARPRYGSVINRGVRSLPPLSVVAVEGPPENPSAVVLRGKRHFARGAVLSVPASATLPRGLLARVVSGSSSGGRTRVVLGVMSPFDVVPAGDFSIRLDPTAGQALVAATGCGGISGMDPYRNIKDVRFDGAWNTTRLPLFGEVKTGVRATIKFTVEAGMNVTGGIGIECKVGKSFSVNGMAGPVPVTAGIEGELSGYAGLGTKLHAGGSVRVSLGVATAGTVPYPIARVDDPRFSLDLKSFAEARAGIDLGTKLGIGNDNLASVTAEFSSNIAFSAKPGTCSWDANFGQFSATGKVWKFDVTSPRTPALLHKNLWSSACGPTGNEPPPPPPPNPDPVDRAEISWNTDDTDVDLHVWDADGNHSWFSDQYGIPDARLSSDITSGFGPEWFTDYRSNGRTFTYGLCYYSDHGNGPTDVDVRIVDPNGAERTSSHYLEFSGDRVLLGSSPPGGGYVPDDGWCN